MSNWRLISPPDAWKHAREIPEGMRDELQSLVRRLGGTYREDAATKKCYVHLTQPMAAPRPPAAATPKDILLPVPYYYQMDSATEQGPRMCQTSSLAMLLKFCRPGRLTASPNADDEYLAAVRKQGDTTDQAAQLRAIRPLLGDAWEIDFSTNCNFGTVDDHLKRGIPFVLGYLHRGSIDHPTGGGHYSVIVGRKADGSAYYVHDPAGELDLVAGRYVATDGKCLLYSAERLGKRWMRSADGGTYTPGRNGWGYVVKKVE